MCKFCRREVPDDAVGCEYCGETRGIVEREYGCRVCGFSDPTKLRTVRDPSDGSVYYVCLDKAACAKRGG
jgi:hypothetical protein